MSDLITKLTEKLRRRFGKTPDPSNRIESLILPSLFWAAQERKKKTDAGPLVIGVNGPQGSGKTTLTYTLAGILPDLGLRAATVSIDDFYLTNAEQKAIASSYPKNTYLQQRGYPGTHDMGFGESILSELIGLGNNSVMHLPVYDKSLCEGRGDRAPREKWRELVGAFDIVFFEGWMLGYKPVAPEFILDSHLGVVNGFLTRYECWTRFIHSWIQLDPAELNSIVDWRVEAEARMRAEKNAGMSEPEVRAYIQKFMPAYRLYLPQLRDDLAAHPSTWRVRLDKDRKATPLQKSQK